MPRRGMVSAPRRASRHLHHGRRARYAGFVKIGGRDFVVRERSPYKAEFDLGALDDYEDFAQYGSRAELKSIKIGTRCRSTRAEEFPRYVEAIAEVTATAHVRGSVGNAPATFKEVIKAVLGTSYARETWGVSVARVAMAYREQVLLDYECFVEYANATVGL